MLLLVESTKVGRYICMSGIRSVHEHLDAEFDVTNCMYIPLSLLTRNGYGVWYSMGQHCTW